MITLRFYNAISSLAVADDEDDDDGGEITFWVYSSFKVRVSIFHLLTIKIWFCGNDRQSLFPVLLTQSVSWGNGCS